MKRVMLTTVIGLALAGGAFSVAAQTATNTATPAAAKTSKKAKPATTPAPAATPAAKPTTTTAAAKPAPATKPAKPATTAAASPSTAPKGHGGGVKMADRTPISIECSKQADAKGLHGKDRQKFREGCMKPSKQ